TPSATGTGAAYLLENPLLVVVANRYRPLHFAMHKRRSECNRPEPGWSGSLKPLTGMRRSSSGQAPAREHKNRTRPVPAGSGPEQRKGAMEAQRQQAREHEGATRLTDGAPITVVHLHGVPVPSRVFGFSATSWSSDEAFGPDLAERRLTLLVGADDECPSIMR